MEKGERTNYKNAVQQLIKDTDHKIYLIHDNPRAHHSKATNIWVEKHKDRIRLYYLPPSSPEYNLDEHHHALKQSIGN